MKKAPIAFVTAVPRIVDIFYEWLLSKKINKFDIKMRYDSIDMIGIINCYHVRVKDNLFLRLIMRRGRPTKKIKRNISGLKNQDVSSIASHDSSPGSTSPAPGPGVRPQPIVPDSTGIDWEEDDVAPMDSDLDDQMELDIWDDEDLVEES